VNAPDVEPQSTSEVAGLILQADEGERMVRRWGYPVIIKVDPPQRRLEELRGDQRRRTARQNDSTARALECSSLTYYSRTASGFYVLGDPP
jgi:hypothetical protein